MSLLLPVGLILLGLLLVTLEVYLIPGLNVVGAMGVIAIAAGVVLAFVEIGPLGGLLAFVGSVGGGALLFTYLWRSGAWNRFILADDLRRDDLTDRTEQETRARLLQQEGTALTPLRPTGIADIGGERVEVTTEGAFISAGSRIRIVAMDRRRYFVRLAEG